MIKKTNILLGIVFLSSWVWAGWSSNGGNNSLDKDNIWFFGQEPIPYCIMTSSSAPPKGAVQMMIQQSNQKWKSFFAKYKIADSELPTFANGTKSKPTLELKLESNCTEIEVACGSQKTDVNKCEQLLADKILFLIGSPNQVVKNYLQINGSAMGAAIRTEFNNKTNRSGGIVWISSANSSSWDVNSHMILHEMGHIYGMKHDSTWVMAENVAKLLNQTFYSFGGLGMIEAPNWPYSYSSGDVLFFTDKRFADVGSPKGFYKNKYFLDTIALEFLEFQPESYFQIKGEIIYSSYSQAHVKFTFEESPSGKMHSFEVRLDNVMGAEERNAPQIYSKWLNEKNDQYFSTKKLDKGWVSNSLMGVADFKGEKIAIKLERKKGLILSIHFPKSDRWLHLATVQYDWD